MWKELTKRFKKEIKVLKPKLILFAFFIFYNFYVMMVPAKNLVFYLSDPQKDIVIKDFLHKLFPEYKKSNISDIPQTILWLVSVILLLFIPIIFEKCHRHQIYSINNFMFACALNAIMFTTRAISFTITIMPDPSYVCRYQLIKKPDNLFGNC